MSRFHSYKNTKLVQKYHKISFEPHFKIRILIHKSLAVGPDLNYKQGEVVAHYLQEFKEVPRMPYYIKYHTCLS